MEIKFHPTYRSYSVGHDVTYVDMSHNVGNVVNFYGVDGNLFKLDDKIFRVVEDESDGYRSSLDGLSIHHAGKFFKNPLTKVRILDKVPDTYDSREEKLHLYSNGKYFDGWILQDIYTNKLVLMVGTDNADDYYPCFVYNYVENIRDEGPDSVNIGDVTLEDIVQIEDCYYDGYYLQEVTDWRKSDRNFLVNKAKEMASDCELLIRPSDELKDKLVHMVLGDSAYKVYLEEKERMVEIANRRKMASKKGWETRRKNKEKRDERIAARFGWKKGEKK